MIAEVQSLFFPDHLVPPQSLFHLTMPSVLPIDKQIFRVDVMGRIDKALVLMAHFNDGGPQPDEVGIICRGTCPRCHAEVEPQELVDRENQRAVEAQTTMPIGVRLVTGECLLETVFPIGGTVQEIISSLPLPPQLPLQLQGTEDPWPRIWQLRYGDMILKQEMKIGELGLSDGVVLTGICVPSGGIRCQMPDGSPAAWLRRDDDLDVFKICWPCGNVFAIVERALAPSSSLAEEVVPTYRIRQVNGQELMTFEGTFTEERISGFSADGGRAFEARRCRQIPENPSPQHDLIIGPGIHVSLVITGLLAAQSWERVGNLSRVCGFTIT